MPETPKARPGTKPVPNPCPRCDATGLYIEARLRAQPRGTYSLADVQTKVAAQEWPYIVCRACGAEAPARAADWSGRGDAQFHPDDIAVPGKGT
jgi:hypothetical protein